MKSLKSILAVVITSLCLVSTTSRADLIDLGVYPQPGGSNGNSSEAAELAFLNSTVIPGKLAEYSFLPTATIGTENIETPDGPTSIILWEELDGWTYLKLKWGNYWQYYYILGTTDPTQFGPVQNPAGQGSLGLSHYTLFGHTAKTPDGGSTLLLLGATLFGVGLVRRRLVTK